MSLNLCTTLAILSALVMFTSSCGTPDFLTAFNDFNNFTSLIADRLDLGFDVAVYKLRNQLPILNPDREAQIISNIVDKSMQAGLNVTWAREFFIDQMEANKAVQQHVTRLVDHGIIDLQRWPQVDLGKTIRPRIDIINSGLIELADKTRVLRQTHWCDALLQADVEMIGEHMDRFDDHVLHIFVYTALDTVCL